MLTTQISVPLTTVHQTMGQLFKTHHGLIELMVSPNMTMVLQNRDLQGFDPKKMDFSHFTPIWIRKPWPDIILRSLLVLPILLLGILGNSAIIYTVCRYKVIRSKPTNVFLLNMAVADLFATMICSNAGLINSIHQYYVFGSTFCRLEGFIKITCLLVSILSLIVLSFDRLISIIKPFWKRFGVRQAMIANFAIWIVSMLMASPLIFWRELIRRQWRDIEEVWCSEDVQYSKYYWLIITAFLIYLPMATMTIVFCVILAQMDKFGAKLRRSSISTLHNPAVASIKISYRRKIIKVLIIYLLTTTICWTPLQVTVFYRHFRKEAQLPSWFQEAVFFSQTFASLSSAINPIIFGILSEPFRKALSTSRLFKFAKKFNGVVKRPSRQSLAHQPVQFIPLDCGGLQVQRTKQNSEDSRQLSASKRSDNIPKTSPDSRQKRSSNQTHVTKGNLNAERTPSPKARQQSLSREQNKSPPDTNAGLNRLGVTFARTISRRGLKNVAPNHSDENRATTSHGRQNIELSPPKQRKMRMTHEDAFQKSAPTDDEKEKSKHLQLKRNHDCRTNERPPSDNSPSFISVNFTSIILDDNTNSPTAS